MTPVLQVFAKAPVAGQCKTRLIPALGAEGAAQLHTRLAELRTLHDLDTPADLARLKTTPQFASLLDGLGP